MGKGPGLYSDIGKLAKGETVLLRSISHNLCYGFDNTFVKPEIRIHSNHFDLFLLLDLLTKDYNSDQKLTVKSFSTTGVVSSSNFTC